MMMSPKSSRLLQLCWVNLVNVKAMTRAVGVGRVILEETTPIRIDDQLSELRSDFPALVTFVLPDTSH